jgi:soluble P-type ATPase
MKTAIVFDSAGTLLRVYRVAWDVKSKTLVENIVSTNMIAAGGKCVLIALRIDTIEYFEKADSRMAISDFIAGENVGFDVICRGLKCTSERIGASIALDRSATMRDIKEAIEAVKLKCKDIYYLNIGLVVDIANNMIPYVLATGGRIFPGAKETVEKLISGGVDVYIASGDNRRSLDALACDLGIDKSNVYDAVSPSGKMDLVVSLEEKYDLVVMVGDGINDQLAFQAADMSILTLQQEGMKPDVLYETADVIIDDIREVEGVVRESLHTNISNK